MEQIDSEMTVGMAFREKLIPQAVRWYTGEIQDDEYDDEEDEDGSFFFIPLSSSPPSSSPYPFFHYLCET